MAAEPGGIGAKLGGQYEARFAAEQLLRMVAGRIVRLRWEPASGEEGGADVEVERSDATTEHIQLKRQNRADAEWSIAALDGAGVLAAAAKQTAHPGATFIFVSADPVPHLKDISDQLTRSSESGPVFVASRIATNKDRHAAFRQLLDRWGLRGDSDANLDTAIARLRAMRFLILDRTEQGREHLLLAAQQALTGAPEQVVPLLQAFLEQWLGRNIVQQDLLEYLRDRNVHPRDLARDPSLPSALLALREEFRDALRERLVGGVLIRRPEAATALDRLIGAAPPRVLVVHGKPGAGKSDVLLEIVDGLIERDIPVLPLSLSTRPPDGNVQQYGQSLGLHASPVAALRATSGDRRAVLLVDQLDALRLTTSGATATWTMFSQILRSALADPETSLVVACRTFDLEYDLNIKRWKEDADQAHAERVVTVEVGRLSPTDVQSVLRPLGVGYDSLPQRLKNLLLHPNTLDAWYRLVKSGTDRRDFATQTQLLGFLIDTLRAEASRESQVSDADIQLVIDRAREQMEEQGRLALPVTLFDDRLAALRACCAAGILVRTGGTVAFPHQSYFDHSVARAALRKSGHAADEIVSWIKKDQALQRRDQLRQLLFVLREEDPTLAADVAERVLGDREIRFHLKQLVFGVLREAEVVTAHDVAALVRLAATSEWAEHLRARLFWRSTTWFDALHSVGQWATWLDGAGEAERLEWLRVVCSVMQHRPAAVDEILRPVLAARDGADVLGRVLFYDPSHDSPGVAVVREREVEKGEWIVHDSALEAVAEANPEYAVRLLASMVRGRLRQILAAAETDDRVRGFNERAFERGVAQAIRSRSGQAFAAYSRLLCGCERLRNRCRRRRRESNHLAAHVGRVPFAFDGVVAILTNLTAEAVAGLAEHDPETFETTIESLLVRRSPALSCAVSMGMREAPQVVADVALRWLCGPPDRMAFQPTHTRDKYGLAADVVRRHAPSCSPGTLARLESVLLNYFPEEEKENYRFRREHFPQILAEGHPVGRAQHLLLSAVPDARRSAVVRHRVALWDNKFGGPAAERPDVTGGGWVGSPIPRDRLGHLSDRQWLDMASERWTGRSRKQVSADRIAEASHTQFANDLGECAKRWPQRFVRLAQRFPAEAPPVYVARLWGALGDRETDTSSCGADELDALAERTIAGRDPEVLMAACHAIAIHPSAAWGGAGWRLLAAAVGHEHPAVDQYTVYSEEDGARVPDVETTSINCVRGAVGAALAALAWNDVARAAQVVPLARVLATDPHPAVRMAAAHAALGIFTTNKNEGAALLGALLGHEDDKLLVGHWVNNLIQYVRWSHPGSLNAVFERMVGSKSPEVSKRGACWVTAECFQRDGANRTLYERCSAGTSAQRTGVAETLGHLLAHGKVDDTRALESALVRYFDDGDDDVRAAAAAVFRDNGILDTPAGPRLALPFVGSVAFTEHSENLIWPLAHQAIELTAYAPAVFASADRFAAELAPETRSIQNRNGLAGRDLSALLLRLYDAAIKSGDAVMADACLDRWDGLLANRVGEAEEHLETFAT